MKFGFQGIVGSYSESALQQHIDFYHYDKEDKIEEIGYEDFKQVIDALVSNKIDQAMIPIENSTTGLITRTMDLFRYLPVIATDEYYQTVQHTLWGIKGSSIETLTAVYSHPEALSQCTNFFEKYPKIEPRSYEDTAKAAEFVCSQNNPEYAALSSPRAGVLYDLVPLKNEVNSERTNTTRFLVMKSLGEKAGEAAEFIAKKQNLFSKKSRLILYIETLNQPGALVKVLQVFEIFDCDLEGLNARPIRDRPFHYGFFIEVNLSHLSVSFHLLWETIAHTTERSQIIGLFEPKKKNIKNN